jgi:hypothetical protein
MQPALGVQAYARRFCDGKGWVVGTLDILHCTSIHPLGHNGACGSTTCLSFRHFLA